MLLTQPMQQPMPFRAIMGLSWRERNRNGGSAIYKAALIQRWLGQRSRYYVHFAPPGSSSFNPVDRWFRLFTEKQLRRGVHRSTRELEEPLGR